MATAVNLSERAAGCPSPRPRPPSSLRRFIAAESVLLAFQSNFLPQDVGRDRGRELVLKILRLLNPQLRGLLFGRGEKREGKVEGYISMRRQTVGGAFARGGGRERAGAIFVSPAAMTNSFGGNT